MPIPQSTVKYLITAYDEANAERHQIIDLIRELFYAAAAERITWYEFARQVHEFADRSFIHEKTLEFVARQRAHLQVTESRNYYRTQRARAKRGAQAAPATNDPALAARVQEYHERSLAERTIKPPKPEPKPEPLPEIHLDYHGPLPPAEPPPGAHEYGSFHGNSKTVLHVAENPLALRPDDLTQGLDFES